MNDPLERLLASHPIEDDGGRLQRRILARTLAELRRRRRSRWASYLSLAACAALIGVALGVVSAPPVTLPRSIPHDRIESPPIVSAPSAVEKEWQALESDSSPALYGEAAKSYLEEGDPANAARCYGHALNESNEKSLDVTEKDDWLLAAIKHSRKKENNQCGR